MTATPYPYGVYDTPAALDREVATRLEQQVWTLGYAGVPAQSVIESMRRWVNTQPITREG